MLPEQSSLKQFSSEYLAVLRGELAGLNLTRILNEEDFFYKQIYDSVIPLSKSEVFNNSILKTKRVVDIGFGGGFPILPLAYCLPEVSFIGFEARRKKSDAVNLIAKRLGLKNVKTFHKRIEDINLDIESVITFKAVGEVSKYLKMMNFICTSKVFFYKGPEFETKESLKDLKHFEIIENIDFEVPCTDGRKLIGFQNVPRRTNSINNKDLVNLSQFF